MTPSEKLRELAEKAIAEIAAAQGRDSFAAGSALMDFENEISKDPQTILTLLSEKEAAEASVAVLVEHCIVLYVDCSTTPQTQYHYCAICGRNRDDVPVSMPIEHAADCPLHSLSEAARAHLEYVARLEADLAKARANGSVWCTIENAPKDGTHILVWSERQPFCPVTSVHWFANGWHLSVNQHAEFSEYVWGPPSHWMLSPAIRQARSATSGGGTT